MYFYYDNIFYQYHKIVGYVKKNEFEAKFNFHKQNSKNIQSVLECKMKKSFLTKELKI